MIIRVFPKRSDREGEFRHYTNIKMIKEYEKHWEISSGEDSVPIIITKDWLIGLPQIVE